MKRKQVRIIGTYSQYVGLVGDVIHMKPESRYGFDYCTVVFDYSELLKVFGEDNLLRDTYAIHFSPKMFACCEVEEIIKRGK